MNTRLLIPLCLVGAVALARGSRSHSDANASSASSRTSAVTHHHAIGTSAATQINPAFAVTAAPNALRFDLALRNDGDKHVELAFPSGQEYDFAIVDSHGRIVYRWGKGRMFTQSRQNRMLDGGDTMHIKEVATTDLAPGSYVAVATLRSSNYPVRQQVGFELR